jgi:folate-dependent phosphoribosylglycinamide formyltransferase PurN
MKTVLICGSHPRHLYIANELFKADMLAGIVIEEREIFVPAPPEGLPEIDRENFIKHFAKRDEAENRFFGSVNINEILKKTPYLKTSIEKINDSATVGFIRSINPDFLFSFGCHMLSEEIVGLCKNSFNLHGGLSPWFKGSITLFWPFYFLKPNWAGMTLHRHTQKIDAGDILHQSVPLLEAGDGLHDVSCRAVFQGGKDMVKVLELAANGKEVVCTPQKATGKLFLDKDWQPQHLRLIYNMFDDDITDRYLKGEILSENPKLIDFLRT